MVLRGGRCLRPLRCFRAGRRRIKRRGAVEATDGNEQVIYQAWQFYAACGLGMLGVAGALLAYRLRVERRILELKQEAVLVRERERLARDMHDGLGVSLTRIKLLSEVASRQCSEAADLRASFARLPSQRRMVRKWTKLFGPSTLVTIRSTSSRII